MSKFTKIAIWTGIILLALNLIGTIIIPLYQKAKLDKLYELKISMEAEKIQRKRLQAEKEALIKLNFNLINKLEKAETNYEDAKNIDYSDSSYNYMYIKVTEFLERR